jgi:hypothetical protein
MPTRRSLLAAAGSGVILPLAAGAQSSTGPAESASALVDTNAALGQWPFRHHPLAPASALARKLRLLGVTSAWTGNYDALLHKDISGVNQRTATDCQRHGAGILVPVGELNLALPDWREDLRRIVEVHRMRVVRLHPNYHGYGLDSPEFGALLELAAGLRLLVQITVAMEDERTLHPLMAVPPVDTGPLATLLPSIPGARAQLLNAFRATRGLALGSLAKAGAVFEIATLEGVEGVAKMLDTLPAEALCFGTHAPFFYPESALLKLKESPLTPDQLEAVRHRNAGRLMAV